MHQLDKTARKFGTASDAVMEWRIPGHTYEWTETSSGGKERLDNNYGEAPAWYHDGRN
jgi:hypothetical protein